MSRRLIIGILVVLILGVLGGTVVFIVQRFGGQQPVTSTGTADTPSLTAAQEGGQQVVDPQGDSDNDGLPNAQEIIWGTDPDNPDSDGDGFTDGEEVASNHNPTVVGPNDLLPQGFLPRVDIQPDATQPVAIEQLFATRVDLFPHDGRNLTNEYNARFSESERSTETAVIFAKEQGIITALPAVSDTNIPFTNNDSRLTLGHYLDMANAYTSLLDATTVGEIFSDLFDNNNVSSAAGMAVYVTDYQAELRITPVPPSAANLHKLLLGFTEVLRATYTQMTAYNDDPIKAMNAIYQLEILDQQYVPLIRNEIRRLEGTF